MRARTWGIVIAVNLILSAAIILIVLFIWENAQTPSSPTPAPASTPTPLALAEATPTSTAPPIASPTSLPPLLVYTVQEGDTLGAIAQTYGVTVEELMAINNLADPNVLSIGQTLIIPVYYTPTPGPAPSTEAPTEPPPTPAPLPTPPPTLTPSTPPLVEISQVLGSGSLAAERVIVRNRGGLVTLEEWSLSDAEGNTFVFPALTLFTDAEVRVHSGMGRNTPSDLYWSRNTPAWSGGELIALRDAAGNVVNTYIVP
jgi:LysM repeat protein